MLLIKNASEVFLPSGIKRNCSILIEDGRIKKISKNIKKKGAEVIDAEGKTILPGFVDCHTHAVFSGSREFELEMKLEGLSYTDIASKGGGINYTVKETRKASKEKLVKEAKKRLDRMLEYGTTTAEIKSGYGLDLKNEIKILEVIKKLNDKHVIDIIPTFLGAHAVPPEISKEDYVNEIINEMIPLIAEKKLALFCDIFCEKGYFSVEEAGKILNEGKKHGLMAKIHADEFSAYGGAELAAEIKAVSADHLLMASENGIKKMAKAGVTAVLLPAVPFSLFQEEYANARKMINNGVRVALATDLNPNCWTESMQFIIQLACFKMKMTAREAINAATLNAAHAIKMEKEVGSIEVGKKGDFVIIDAPSHAFLTYHFGVNLADMVIKNGRIVWER
ncbi:imidazolonepropionase [Thermoplasmatales archaeon ex4484_30]|nr:MAG: imidazolonepropionase [Thermoplasmatales archaeon ex4484_30]